MEWLNSETLRLLHAAKLPEKLKLKRDKELLIRLLEAFPKKLSNVAIAAELNVSEGAIRKRRKRVGRICFEIAGEDRDLRDALRQLGLKEGTK